LLDELHDNHADKYMIDPLKYTKGLENLKVTEKIVVKNKKYS
jgi:hypothetical protein